MPEVNPPKVGQKVFLPELNLYGEIVEFYDEAGQLISKVRVFVNGKPTLIETTVLLVEAAQSIGKLVAVGRIIWSKAKAFVQGLCRVFRLCKRPASTVPAAAKLELERLDKSSRNPLKAAQLHAVLSQIEQPNLKGWIGQQ